MKSGGLVSGLVLGVCGALTAAVLAGRVITARGQDQMIIDLPDLGLIDLSQLPQNVRQNLRIPGVDYGEPPEEIGDIPDNPAIQERGVFPLPEADIPSGTDLSGSGTEEDGLPPGLSPEELQSLLKSRWEARQELLQRMERNRVYPRKEIPEGAYQQAWEQIQHMQPAEVRDPDPPTPSEIGSESVWSAGVGWLARVLTRLNPRSATAAISVPPWTLIGPAPLAAKNANAPTYAGIAGQVAVHPTPTIMYLGTAGGTWKTTNQGGNWTPITDGSAGTGGWTVVLHPANASLVYAGTGSGLSRNGLGAASPAVGILRSPDGGTSWARIGPAWPPGTSNDQSLVTVYRLMFDGSRMSQGGAAYLYAATSAGLFYSDNPDAPLPTDVRWYSLSQSSYQSTGLPTNTRNPESVTNIMISPWNNQTLFASIYPGTILFAPPLLYQGDKGFYRSDNLGQSWSLINDGLPQFFTTDSSGNITQAAMAPRLTGSTSQDILYSLVYSSTPPQNNPSCPTIATTHLYRGISTAISTTWTEILTPGDCPNTGGQGPDASLRSVEVDPGGGQSLTAHTVVLGGTDAFVSTDGGNSFGSVFNNAHRDFDWVTFGPVPSNSNNNAGLYVGTDGGVWLSMDRGRTAQNLNGDLATIQFYAGAIDPLNYGISCGGSQDNGIDRGGTPLLWSMPFLADGGPCIFDPTNSNLGYLMLTGAFGKTKDGWLTEPLVRKNLPSNPSQLAIDPTDHNVLVALAIYKVYRSRNGAEGVNPWSSITEGVPTSLSGAVTSLVVVPSLTSPSSVIVASDCGRVWRTLDATEATGSSGSHWTCFGTNVGGTACLAASLPNRCFTSIAINSSAACKGDPNQCIMYMSAGGFDESPGAPSHVFRSSDGGQTWQNVSGVPDTCNTTTHMCPITGLQCDSNTNTCPYVFPNVSANKVIIDPNNSNLVYVATDLAAR